MDCSVLSEITLERPSEKVMLSCSACVAAKDSFDKACDDAIAAAATAVVAVVLVVAVVVVVVSVAVVLVTVDAKLYCPSSR